MAKAGGGAREATADLAFEQALYQKREKIYPREVHDLFAALRASAATGLLGLYYVLPWLSLNGQPLVLFDLPGRKFHIFGATFWPQDFLILTFILLLAAFSLFFFTALAGRIWCGYACPQTVWTEWFLWVERKVEGTPAKQRALDAAAWSGEKIVKKTGKHAIWLLIAFTTAFTFVAYFVPARVLTGSLLTLQPGFWVAFWIVFFTAATYFNAGWMREQVCKYMCPYARFQSAMFDRDTLIISYDRRRGDPRGSRRIGSDHHSQGLGDCIDCKFCVQVCPTGIDIRDGLQYECISCSACIDACNGVMDKVGYPRGLIRYTTENAVEGRRSRILRPRVIIYLALLAALSLLTVHNLERRVPLSLNVFHDRNQLYRDVGPMIENVYSIQVLNMDEEPHVYRLSVSGILGLKLVEDALFEVTGSSIHEHPVRLRVPERNLRQRSTPVTFTVTSMEVRDLVASREARFLGPQP